MQTAGHTNRKILSLKNKVKEKEEETTRVREAEYKKRVWTDAKYESEQQ